MFFYFLANLGKYGLRYCDAEFNTDGALRICVTTRDTPLRSYWITETPVLSETVDKGHLWYKGTDLIILLHRPERDVEILLRSGEYFAMKAGKEYRLIVFLDHDQKGGGAIIAEKTSDRDREHIGPRYTNDAHPIEARIPLFNAGSLLRPMNDTQYSPAARHRSFRPQKVR